MVVTDFLHEVNKKNVWAAMPPKTEKRRRNMRAENAVLYFTDPDTKKQMMVELPNAVVDVSKEYEQFDAVYKTEEFNLTFNEFKLSTVPTIKHVVHSNNVCTVIWSDGVKTQSTCHPEDIYNKDVGVLVAYLKRFMPTEQIIELVEKWSHQQKKQEDVIARKKAAKARKQVQAELDEAKDVLRKQFEENTVLFEGEDKKKKDIDILDSLLYGYELLENIAEYLETSKETELEEECYFIPIKYIVGKG